MKIISKEILKKINFSDFKVISTNIDKISKSIIFYISGACQLSDKERIKLGSGYLKIMKYNSIHITSYNAKNKTETILSENNYEPLCEICEINIFDNELIIKGFSEKNYNWIEFTINGGELTGEFSDIEKR